MTHRQRLMAALKGQVPDQVPVTWELVGRFAHRVTGDAGWRGQCDAHRMIGSSIFNLQGVGPQLQSGPREGYGWQSERAELPDGSALTTNTIVTPRGSLTERHRSGYLKDDPTVSRRIEPFVKERADYEVYADYVATCARAASFVNSAAHEAQRYVGEDGLVGFWMADSLYQLSGARRDVQLIVDLMEAPSVMERVLEQVDEQVELGLRAFNESEADVLVYDVCWASTSLLSPRMVEQFVVPRARWVVEHMDPTKIVGFFTSGRIRDVLPQLVDCGPAFIEHLDVLGDCDLAEVKSSFGHRVCLMGNYNPVVLARGSLEDARGEARRCLEAAMAGGGYVMSTSDEVPVDAKLDSMKAVVDYVAEHGRYR